MSGGKNTFANRLVKSAGWLDGLANILGAIVSGFYRIPGTRPLKDLLHGVWPLHHPLHPAATDLTIGGYTAVLAVDVYGIVTGDRGLVRAADFLLVASLVSSVASILSGVTDWNDTFGAERRTGMVHGLIMAIATIGFVASLTIRLQGNVDARTLAVALSTGAWLVMIAASYLGGEMVFGFGTQVNRLAWSEVSSKWQTLELRADTLQDRVPVVIRTAQGVDLFISTVDGNIVVMTNTCTHAGGPLNEGTWVGADRCQVACSWHGSRFDVRDGSVHRGPATFDAATWETRVSATGALEIHTRA